jgi:hypothetical protein
MVWHGTLSDTAAFLDLDFIMVRGAALWAAMRSLKRDRASSQTQSAAIAIWIKRAAAIFSTVLPNEMLYNVGLKTG